MNMGLLEKIADAKSSDWLCKDMTDEEVIKVISEAKEEARKRIKLVDTLDKIRAEIEALEEGITSYHNDRPWIFKDEVLQIIDKYKAESDKESEEINNLKYKVFCPLCDNDKCVRGTDKCEAEIWVKQKESDNNVKS